MKTLHKCNYMKNHKNQASKGLPFKRAFLFSKRQECNYNCFMLGTIEIQSVNSCRQSS